MILKCREPEMKRLVEWDQLDVRVDGEKLNRLVQSFRVAPIESLKIELTNGLMRVSGSIRKFIRVPVTVDIAEIRAEGRTVRVPLRSVEAFGGIPIPQFLFGLMKGRLPTDLVRLESPATFVVSLDRFLPPFVDAEVQRIWIIDGGLAVTLGRGGADLPARTEDNDGRSEEHTSELQSRGHLVCR